MKMPMYVCDCGLWHIICLMLIWDSNRMGIKHTCNTQHTHTYTHTSFIISFRRNECYQMKFTIQKSVGIVGWLIFMVLRLFNENCVLQLFYMHIQSNGSMWIPYFGRSIKCESNCCCSMFSEILIEIISICIADMETFCWHFSLLILFLFESAKLAGRKKNSEIYIYSELYNIRSTSLNICSDKQQPLQSNCYYCNARPETNCEWVLFYCVSEANRIRLLLLLLLFFFVKMYAFESAIVVP